MVSRLSPTSRFVVTLWRNGEVLDSRPAPTGERALKVAILMLAELDDLQGGDSMDVMEGPSP